MILTLTVASAAAASEPVANDTIPLCTEDGDRVVCPKARLEAWRDRYVDQRIDHAKCKAALETLIDGSAADLRISRLACDAQIANVKRDAAEAMFYLDRKNAQTDTLTPIVRLSVAASGGAAVTGAAWCATADGCDSRVAVGLGVFGIAAIVLPLIL